MARPVGDVRPLLERLADARLVHVDARVIALHLLGTSPHAGLTRAIFSGLRSGQIRAQTSTVTLYQLLAELFRRGEGRRARSISRALQLHEGLALVPVTAGIAEQAAQVRAQLGGRPERALHEVPDRPSTTSPATGAP